MDGNITLYTVSQTSIRDVFDLPDPSNMNDNILDVLYDRKVLIID